MTADHCECEHASHFTATPMHVYGDAEPSRDVRTLYGTFTLCRPCFAAGHMPEAP